MAIGLDRYAKGARYERELLSKLGEMGYSIVRSAGSGVNSISPDIIGIKQTHALCFECKAWANGSVGIEHEKFESLRKWQENTGMGTYIAWRMNNEGWYFIRLEEMSKNPKSYTITRKKAKEIDRRLEAVVKETSSAQSVVSKNPILGV